MIDHINGKFHKHKKRTIPKNLFIFWICELDCTDFVAGPSSKKKFHVKCQFFLLWKKYFLKFVPKSIICVFFDIFGRHFLLSFRLYCSWSVLPLWLSFCLDAIKNGPKGECFLFCHFVLYFFCRWFRCIVVVVIVSLLIRGLARKNTYTFRL